jgi:hypothetical protein
MLYLGNAYVGQSEQTKLQPYVGGSALFAPSFLPLTHLHSAALLGNYSFTILGRKFVFPTEELTTYFMISLVMPNEFLIASRDVPDIVGTDQPFPPSVAKLTMPFAQKFCMFLAASSCA